MRPKCVICGEGPLKRPFVVALQSYPCGHNCHGACAEDEGLVFDPDARNCPRCVRDERDSGSRPCPVCGMFIRSNELASLKCGHAFHETCMKPWTDKVIFTCPTCLPKDPVVDDEAQCPFCEDYEIDALFETLEDHFKTVHKMVRCNVCRKGFFKTAVRAHELECGTSYVKCPAPGCKEFVSRQVHSRAKDLGNPRALVDDHDCLYMFHCSDSCGKLFFYADDLNDHVEKEGCVGAATRQRRAAADCYDMMQKVMDLHDKGVPMPSAWTSRKVFAKKVKELSEKKKSSNGIFSGSLSKLNKKKK